MEYFKNLPVETMLDILSRLPAELLIDYKFVSKNWNKLISDPSFTKIHLNRLIDYGKLSFLIDSCKLNFLIGSGGLGFLPTPNKFYYFDYGKNNNIISKIDVLPDQETSDFTIVGSCNGLVCLFNYADTIIISNPVIKEYVILPKLTPPVHIDERLFSGYMFCGFGYLPKTEEYKVVRMYTLLKESDSIEVDVYTLGNGSKWRNIGNFEYTRLRGKVGVFGHGALYWLGCEKKVLVFDLADEKIWYIPLPACQKRHECLSFFPMIEVSIWPLGDYLMCVENSLVVGARVNRWFMKMQNGIDDPKRAVGCNWESWDEKFSLPNLTIEPFSFTKSGAVLGIKHLNERCTLHRYDVESSSLETLACIDEYFVGLPFPHMNTLVSLGALGEPIQKIREDLYAF